VIALAAGAVAAGRGAAVWRKAAAPAQVCVKSLARLLVLRKPADPC